MTQAKTEHKCRVINDLLLDLENEGSIPFNRSIQHPEMILPISNRDSAFTRYCWVPSRGQRPTRTVQLSRGWTRFRDG